MRSLFPTKPQVWAVLGPTNTGKTHLALERMMGHASGAIGFPLRLLARENYDRAVRAKGPGQVALLTGEERIVPPRARYYLCTVESMPTDREVAFLGVDEVQLCADPERGHVFTDRLLSARGLLETMFMGADTIAPFLRRLLPEVRIETRPRFSKLTYTGYRNLARLPPKSAVVAFSAAEVYGIAELIRRQKGGAAVVLGALSPRTRNAQVALYQAGEVEYIVATDAIGMGLNMDVDHVAFAGASKFDGRRTRPLTAPELGQIAGRAGRHLNDGTFGVTADTPPFDAKLVERLEAHDFQPLERLYWRNSRLRFRSVEGLLADLRMPPPAPGLVRPRAADDERALEFLAQDPEVRALAADPAALRLLWEVCQIPDFRKDLTDSHPRLLGQIFGRLRSNEGRLPAEWLARQVERLDRTEGDLETLTSRLAGIRTWTYVAQKARWVDDAGRWQERTRAVEDRLSDALHEQLTERFVDRRTSTLLRRLKDRGELLAGVAKSGDVLVEGHYVGRLEGFHFAAEDAEGREAARAARAVNAAALKALRAEMGNRVRLFAQEPDEAFALRGDGRLLWRGAPVARLTAGPEALRPRVETLPFDLLETAQREKVRERLAAWFERHVGRLLGPLLDAEKAGLEGAARGLLFQLARGLGSVARSSSVDQVESLRPEARRRLRRLGVRFARASVYFPALVAPESVALRAVLWTVHRRSELPPAATPPGTAAVSVEPGAPAAFYEAVGYRVCGSFAVRVDVVEAVAEAAWERSRGGPFAFEPSLVRLVGGEAEVLAGVLSSLGYAIEGSGDGWSASRRKPRGRPSPRPRRDSPFARLGELKVRDGR